MLPPAPPPPQKIQNKTNKNKNEAAELLQADAQKKEEQREIDEEREPHRYM